MAQRQGYDVVIDPDESSERDLGETELHFQEFNDPMDGSLGSGPSRYPKPPGDGAGKRLLWSIQFYAQYFDIDTKDLFARMWAAIYPRTMFFDVLDGNPDLYGPFWILTTVIVVLFVSSTVAGYVASHASGAAYQYDFSLLSAAAAMMYGYSTLIPLGLWFALRWYRCEAANLLDCIALYGYGNLVWIPVALVSTCPFEILNWTTLAAFIRWASIVVGFIVSGFFLFCNLTPIINTVDAKTARLLLIVLVLFHAGISLAIKFVFFAYKVRKA